MILPLGVPSWYLFNASIQARACPRAARIPVAVVQLLCDRDLDCAGSLVWLLMGGHPSNDPRVRG